MLKIYETQRLILRQIDESWAEEVLQYYNRNRFFLSEWEPQRPEEFYTLDFQKKFLQEDFKSNENGTIFRLWITNKNDEQKIIGCITFNLIVRGVLQSCILGYKLDKEELNKGLITEGIKKAIIVVFDELKIHRIEAPIMPINMASIKVVSKLGFENEGLSKKYIKVNGKWEDHTRWALINRNEQ
ncbi:GNAT family N-acetyltransferase [Lysinibacillus mangiferihumi]|uniref:GNAT family N-acetyltransferase n=1 Tax=Lysinibacillus mangiferihumi TaxID=1130819 RepID=A0A4U2ZEM6_9BACI|nr:GNAT family N-acetyltransferase [Lysinibacillus mangiferihumi]TKI72854.1 GNAT family N-acetyltransferase [Lysinibacillus mangiferihumi]